MASVTLDSFLAEFVPKRRLTIEAGSLPELLDRLEAQYPALRFRLRDETGRIRRFVRLFVNGQEVPRSAEAAAPLGPDDSVDVLHSIQGG
ncbi:MAG TPA: MoaD/ThiS family protein [Thermoplasmata archaeon]|nr:MoaD/ThiS family protein [Thermoplasmata archaeon]